MPQPRAMPLIGAAYFVNFVMFGTMIMLNLFIGVIINSIDSRRDRAAELKCRPGGIAWGGSLIYEFDQRPPQATAEWNEKCKCLMLP